MKVTKEIEIGELFNLLGIKKQGSYKAPKSLKVETPLGYKKVNGLLKTQLNPEWEIETEEGSKGCFADYHKLESLEGEIDLKNQCFWKFVKDFKAGDFVKIRSGWEVVKNVFFNGNYSEMYDLNVEETNSFWTNNFHSHNTGFLGNIAINNFLKENRNVLVYTFETSSERLLMRYYANIAEMSKKEIIGNENEVKKRVERVTSLSKGELMIKEYNANEICSNDLLAHIKDLEMYNGFIPEIVFVDYILIMRTNDRSLSSDDSYKYYKTVTEELRNIAKTLYVPVVTACQINREGMSDRGGSKALTTSKMVFESRGILDTVDVFMTINQTATDKQKERYYLYFDKNRNERTGIKIAFDINYEFMKLEDKGIV